MATSALLAVTLSCACLAAAPKADLLIADFEASDYGTWKTTGEAFGTGPAQGTLPGQMHVDGFQGKRLVNSFLSGDGTTGTLTSPPFEIQRRYIRFLIGGGGYTNETCINLLVEGKTVRSATGPNLQPGGTERLELHAWDVGDLAGVQAVLQIVDARRGGWGHINVDEIVQTDTAIPRILTNATRRIRAEHNLLQFPVCTGMPKRNVSILTNDRLVRSFEIELAEEKIEWWAPLDVSIWRGSTLTIEVDRLPENSRALESVVQGDALKGGEDLYRERLRPQFHFSAQRGWNNDPNGLVFYRGEYHLFFQHNPFGWHWGNMHWGHAVSRDLLHWQELGDVLAPDELGPMFSGSAVVDWSNTSGFGANGQPPLVLIYTAAGNPAVQCLAYSTDGRSFTKYSGNPVLKQITAGNRDPKVIWHQPSRKWVMALYVELDKRHTVHFFTSPDLQQWTLASISEGGTGSNHFLFECPDLFELMTESNQRLWVLTAANSQYALGGFDGVRFQLEAPLPESAPGTSSREMSKHGRRLVSHDGHSGKGFYAAQTFSDIPATDGRRIQIGWLQAPAPGMPFNQAMSLPMELKLIPTTAGPRLTWTPIKELESLRVRTQRLMDLSLLEGSVRKVDHVGELLEIAAEFARGDPGQVRIVVRGANIVLDCAKEEITVNGHSASAPWRDGRQKLTIYCDRTTLEVFASDGLSYIPMPFIPEAEDRSVTVSASGGFVRMTSFMIHELESAWPGHQ